MCTVSGVSKSFACIHIFKDIDLHAFIFVYFHKYRVTECEFISEGIFGGLKMYQNRECVRNLYLRVQMHPGELWVSKQRVHIVLEASKSAGANAHLFLRKLER